jgi:hypothetical protein
MARRKQTATVTIEAGKLKEIAGGDPGLLKRLRDQTEYIETCLRVWDAAKKEAKQARETYDEAVELLIVLCKGEKKDLFSEVATELANEELDG